MAFMAHLFLSWQQVDGGKILKCLQNALTSCGQTTRKKNVLIALKAIAERDFEDIANEHDYDDDVTLEVFLQNFEKVYIDDIVYWLDERDLKAILLFCGED